MGSFVAPGASSAENCASMDRNNPGKGGRSREVATFANKNRGTKYSNYLSGGAWLLYNCLISLRLRTLA
jgi:hypothetical protein